MKRIAITEKALDALTLPPDKAQVILWCKKLRGFGYVLGATGGTFVTRIRRANGKRPQEKLGPRAHLDAFGQRTPHNGLLLSEAITKAKAAIGRVAEGKLTDHDVLRLMAEGPTLREAIMSYIGYLEHKHARFSSIQSVRKELLNGPHLRDWLDRPLRSITPTEVRARHLQIGTVGQCSANRIFHNFCTIWKHIAKEAMLTQTTWPPNPSPVVLWFRVHEKRDSLPWSALPAWRSALDQITNKQRRHYNLLLLFLALRKMDCATLRWEHLNLTEDVIQTRIWVPEWKEYEVRELPPGSMLRPFPKGGKEKSFIVPLPAFIISLLAEQKKDQINDGGWVFPTMADVSRPCPYCAELGLGDHVKGEVCHMSDARSITKARREKHNLTKLPAPHALRRTYLSATEEHDPPMPEGIAQALVNHKPSRKTVTHKYRRQDVELLRMWQERQAAFLLARMRGERHLRSVA